jgi:predicted metal-binding membrane protein
MSVTARSEATVRALRERDGALIGVSVLLFAASVAGTIYACGSMSGDMPMPGGWAMSMAWMRMPGQTWTGAAAGFLAMWALMMMAMMLPSLVPALSQYRRSLSGRAGRVESSHGWLTLWVGLGYFSVWALVGAAIYPLGILLAAAEMRSEPLARSVPLAAGALLLLAGIVQLTSWKAELLRQCRDAACDRSDAVRPGGAWRHGLMLGLRCALCCAGFMTVLIVVGVMDLAAMAVVTAAITAERLAARPERAARAAGILVLAAGAVAILRSFTAA